MPAIKCPFPNCEYITGDVDNTLAATLLNIHALTHTATPPPATDTTRQRPPKLDRPKISRGTSEEEWRTFTKKWNLFKLATTIPANQVTTHLWQCCDRDLEADLFREVPDIAASTEGDLLEAIKRLGVISVAACVRKAEVLSLRQDHGQPIRSYAAKVKGKAQTCAFTKKCTATDCQETVDYSEDIVKYVIITGIVDEDIKKDVLGYEGLDSKSLNDTISIIENKEMAARAMNPSIIHDPHPPLNASNSSINNKTQQTCSQSSNRGRTKMERRSLKNSHYALIAGNDPSTRKWTSRMRSSMSSRGCQIPPITVVRQNRQVIIIVNSH